MDPVRRESLKSSLMSQLESESQRSGWGNAPRLRWLGDQLENYIERWIAFSESSTQSRMLLVNDDLFGMIEICHDMLAREISHASARAETAVRSQSFGAVLASVRIDCEIEDLSSSLRNLRAALTLEK